MAKMCRVRAVGVKDDWTGSWEVPLAEDEQIVGFFHGNGMGWAYVARIVATEQSPKTCQGENKKAADQQERPSQSESLGTNSRFGEKAIS